jgi:3-methyladenine DNA glycosylase Tag
MVRAGPAGAGGGRLVSVAHGYSSGKAQPGKEGGMHDPRGEKPGSLAGYLESMSKVIFTSGINWKVVEAKWPGIKEAFGGFDVEKVARLTPDDIDRLAADPRLIRNRKKIEAIADNAAMLLELEKTPGGFAGYLGLLGGFLGPSSAPIFLAMVGEPLPESYVCEQTRKFGSRGGTKAG